MSEPATCAATDWSTTASSGTWSSTDRAGIVVHAPPGHTRTAVTDELERALSGRHGHALEPERDGLRGVERQREEQVGGRVQVRERVDIGAVVGVHLEVEVIRPLGIAGVAVVARSSGRP